MVALNTLSPSPGARKKSKRVGRGTGAGSGCTAGYGNNGAKARSGNRYKPYFEGGQTPMSRRIPKRGFTNRNKTEYQIVNIGRIGTAVASEKEVDAKWLYDRGLIGSMELPVKVLGEGDFTKSIVVKADAFSASARTKIDKAKGKAEVVDGASDVR